MGRLEIAAKSEDLNADDFPQNYLVVSEESASQLQSWVVLRKLKWYFKFCLTFLLWLNL